LPPSNAFSRADLALLRLMRTRGHWPPFERAVVRFSSTGEHSYLWFGICAVGVAVHRGRRQAYLRAARAVAVTEVVNALVKIAIRRRRPVMPDLPPLMATKSNRSLPSAHAASSFTAAPALSQVLPAAAVYPVALAMALSRPYLGVHYPSDVAAGMLLGTAISRVVAPRLPSAVPD
jgi:membrane-associated phospholipid phosphatase